MRKKNLPTECHPDREHVALGKCSQCYKRDRYLSDPDYQRNKNLIKKFGLTVQQYDDMVIRYPVCCICGELNPDGRRLAVDHSHVDGAVRGLLCSNCNRGIGLLRDDAELLRKAADYLDEFRRVEDHR